MSSQSFLTSSGGKIRVQPLGRRRPRVRLSKEARAILTASRREKSHRFKTAIHNVWTDLDESVKAIATSNHKSIRRVQHELYMGQSLLRHKRVKLSAWNAFCWKKNQSVDKENGPSGKALLPELINEHRVEYHALSKEEKDSILKEYEEHRTTKTNGVRISTKSKVNDVTQTLKAIENELNSLRCRTGAETILYTTRGTTDLPLRGIAFATEGVDNFIESVMAVDNQEFVTKMEGFALRGIRGAAKNHQQRCCDLRGEIRQLINDKLQQITKNPKATMQWVHYWRNVVSRYQVIVEGWPDEVPFDNLSKAASGITVLENLKERWRSGETAWRQLDNEEFQELDEERNSKLGSGEVVEHRRRPRSDKGKKRRRAISPNENVTTRPRKKAYTSPATVEDEDDVDSTPVSSHNNSTLDTAPLNDIPVPQAGQPDPFHPSASTSANGLYLPSASSSTGFVDTLFPDFDYEQAIASLNQLLGGPA
ncbi:hypothetical protein DEU56DRAFT_748887 [Suillus clintonianus]|uniref:uncharacterized protein n=1 Tax=Suillus clintonianus TaxID=1904413 RepID=UPI001B8753E7|nr:uncharacterized protein DEU56DRAFT_748887 [Suillus clintonianus]KAG2114522.1 hypothetical protein DEU56DRAFT_748887 [Suillus clintonianus]